MLMTFEFNEMSFLFGVTFQFVGKMSGFGSCVSYSLRFLLFVFDYRSKFSAQTADIIQNNNFSSCAGMAACLLTQ